MYERPTRLEMRSAIIGAITSRTRWTLLYPCFCYWKVSLNLVNKPGSLFDLIRCQLQPLFEEGDSISFHNPFSIFVTLVWPQNFSRKKMWELQELRIFFIRKVVSWKFLFSLHYNFVYYHLFLKKNVLYFHQILYSICSISDTILFLFVNRGTLQSSMSLNHSSIGILDFFFFLNLYEWIHWIWLDCLTNSRPPKCRCASSFYSNDVDLVVIAAYHMVCKVPQIAKHRP